ncbi:Uncharacterized protein BM_BM1417 [Brugia malayi]|uniref:Bm1417, isoform a n=1 Tax=Brugia malayi TaxID=6279 RepID=A0A1P6BMI4_BRUMA|nr:Uncharacterized protein BM_BM1417 [Brugia malayi]CDP98013.1 Bm1417, isoform a [Brugia malayi]VIO93784.1 Uncharacterized protein BM_BM1417 [Brugia malayi]
MVISGDTQSTKVTGKFVFSIHCLLCSAGNEIFYRIDLIEHLTNHRIIYSLQRSTNWVAKLAKDF